MSSTNDSRGEHAGSDSQPSSGQDQEHAGNSGEGAASVLAHLKTQTRQHRRQNGEDDPSGGSSQ
ncbi:MAG: hypothetical protein JWP22_2808 [Ramlibacter sp.]|jgi:hypothetical protein|nr:hypothetical protein [Ramlibacter sp.]MDB5914133.1 hypothetical protein [Ramlibacter sp.]